MHILERLRLIVSTSPRYTLLQSMNAGEMRRSLLFKRLCSLPRAAPRAANPGNRAARTAPKTLRNSQVLTSILSQSKSPSAESKTESQLTKTAGSASFSPTVPHFQKEISFSEGKKKKGVFRIFCSMLFPSVWVLPLLGDAQPERREREHELQLALQLSESLLKRDLLSKLQRSGL